MNKHQGTFRSRLAFEPGYTGLTTDKQKMIDITKSFQKNFHFVLFSFGRYGQW